tara:strand:+ start:130 stop:1206 length:1077 start_codon:yes stop_codon:yes gene_type:complete
MLVENKHLTTIWYEQTIDKVKIIDQRLIPFELKIIELNTVDEVCFAIKEMQVRGAPLIGVAAAFGMYIASKENSDLDHLKNISNKINSTRPTAVNLSWALNKIMSNIENTNKDHLPNKILELANKIRDDDINNCKRIGEHGYKLIEQVYKKKNKPVNILTHCNAGWLATVDWGTALAPIFFAHKKNIPLHIWVDETRPRNQGFSLTAWELLNENIPNSLIVDNAGGHLMQHGEVDMCITGTDRTTLKGDVCNKIGTYLKALAAYDNKIPFYVSAPISSIDFLIEDGVNEIPIEERDNKEVSNITGLDSKGDISTVQITPNSSKCKNYAFDVTPARLISKIITEKGIIEANKESIIKLK